MGPKKLKYLDFVFDIFPAGHFCAVAKTYSEDQCFDMQAQTCQTLILNLETVMAIKKKKFDEANERKTWNTWNNCT